MEQEDREPELEDTWRLGWRYALGSWGVGVCVTGPHGLLELHQIPLCQRVALGGRLAIPLPSELEIASHPMPMRLEDPSPILGVHIALLCQRLPHLERRPILLGLIRSHALLRGGDRRCGLG